MDSFRVAVVTIMVSTMVRRSYLVTWNCLQSRRSDSCSWRESDVVLGYLGDIRGLFAGFSADGLYSGEAA